MFAWWIAAGCAAPPDPIDANLVVSGFDGLAVSGDGTWIRERVFWTDGSQPDEVLNYFVVSDGPDPCDTFVQTTSTSGSTSTDDPVAACEASRDRYAALAGRDVADTLTFEFSLWDTTRSDDHIAIAPEAGTYTPLDGPDADRVEFTFYGKRVLFDWYAAVADELDCASDDPWATVPSQEDALTEFDVLSGSLELEDPRGDDLAFTLNQLEITPSDGPTTPGGTLDGQGVFHACDVSRGITPQPITD